MKLPNHPQRSRAQRVVAGGAERKLSLALLSASLAAWAAGWLQFNIIFGLERVGRGGPVFSLRDLLTSLIFVLAWPIAGALTVVLGLGVHKAVTSLRLLRWPAYVLGGGMAGCLLVLLVAAFPLIVSFNSEPFNKGEHFTALAEGAVFAAVYGGLPGCCAALAFWATPRPDRT